MVSMCTKSFIQDPLQGCPTERMAGELKCPICLGLLNKAASLSCNHVFCNSCILRSLKTISSCPVCKMPVGRREVLATPHMDILVNIYRSMEMAAGVSLFDSQAAPPLDSAERVEEENDPYLDCPDSGKRKSPGLSKRTRKKAKGSGGQNPRRKAVHVQGAAFEAFNSEIDSMINDPDADNENNALGNSSTPNSCPTPNIHTNQDLGTKSPSVMLDQISRPPRTRSACSKVKQEWSSSLACKWVLCCSAIDDAGKAKVADFSNLTGATMSNTWSSEVTHVIAGTDENGAAKRTSKFLMAILEGKWVVNIDWIAACTKAGFPVDEGPFEVTHDVHGVYTGPKHGRVLAAKKTRKLFKGLSFYFCGEFSPSSKTDLEALVMASGGEVLHGKPNVDLESSEVNCCTIVLYSVEFPEGSIKISDRDKAVQRRYTKAKSLADAIQAQVEAHSWLLNTIAACLL
eukprot:Gb_04292 [translate_table: standard]